MSTAIDGEFIPAPTKNVPVRGIISGTEFGLRTIIPKAKSLVRGGLVGIAAGYAFDQMLKGLDWVMTDGQVMAKQPGAAVPTDPQNGEYYYYNQGSDATYSSAAEACAHGIYGMYPLAGVERNGNSYLCTVTVTDDDGSTRQLKFPVFEGGGTCPAGSTHTLSGMCAGPSKVAPVTEQDLGLMDNYIAARDSKFVQDLLRQSCEGSLAPERCYQELRTKQLALRGPSSVDAGSTTTTTTHPNADGTTSTTVTTTNNKYNITYSPTTMTYTNRSSTTTSTDGKPGDSTSTDENPSDEADPEDNPDDDTTPSPCTGVGCDGPKYEKLYEPTKDTKEQALDSYASRVKALPIVSSVAGFFTVNASAGCPSWSTNVSFAVFASMFSYDLVFDFYCQPWFVSMAQYAKIVFSIVCAYLAFRQAILD
jgi:hypothetical protein